MEHRGEPLHDLSHIVGKSTLRIKCHFEARYRTLGDSDLRRLPPPAHATLHSPQRAGKAPPNVLVRDDFKVVDLGRERLDAVVVTRPDPERANRREDGGLPPLDVGQTGDEFRLAGLRLMFVVVVVVVRQRTRIEVDGEELDCRREGGQECGCWPKVDFEVGQGRGFEGVLK